MTTLVKISTAKYLRTRFVSWLNMHGLIAVQYSIAFTISDQNTCIL